MILEEATGDLNEILFMLYPKNNSVNLRTIIERQDSKIDVIERRYQHLKQQVLEYESLNEKNLSLLIKEKTEEISRNNKPNGSYVYLQDRNQFLENRVNELKKIIRSQKIKT